MIEVLVATVVLAVGLVGGLGMMQASRLAASSGNRMSGATALAKVMIEEKLALSFNDLVEGPREGDHVKDGYTGVWTLGLDDDRPQMAMMTVHISWKSGRGRSHQIRLGRLRVEGVLP